MVTVSVAIITVVAVMAIIAAVPVAAFGLPAMLVAVVILAALHLVVAVAVIVALGESASNCDSCTRQADGLPVHAAYRRVCAAQTCAMASVAFSVNPVFG